MKTFSLKAFFAALLASGLVIAGVAAPAHAVATLTVSPSTSSIMGSGQTTTPALTITTSGATVTAGAYDVIDFGLVQMSDGTGLQPNAACMSSPTLSNCNVTSIETSAAGVNSWSAVALSTFTVGDMGGRKFLRFNFSSSVPTGNDIKIELSAGAFAVGNYSGYQANSFDATLNKWYSNMSYVEGFVSPGVIVRTQPPSLAATSSSFSTSTGNPASGSSFVYTTARFSGAITYSTSLDLSGKGYDFDSTTGNYVRNQNALGAQSYANATITATDSGNNAATATVSVVITALQLAFTSPNYSLSTTTSSPPNTISSPSVTNANGSVTYSNSINIPGYTFSTSTGIFTKTGTPTAGTYSVLVTATDSGNNTATTSLSISFGSGGSSVTPTSFTATGSLVDSNLNPITSLPASTSVPAFTATATNPTNNATFSAIGVIFSKISGGTEYFSVANPVNTMAQGAASPSSWSPGVCGITSISIGGVAQTGSSGINCQKQTWTFNSSNAYAVRIYLPAETSSSVSISIDDGVFTSGSAGNYNFRLSLASGMSNNTYFTGSAAVIIAVGGSGSSSPSVSAPSVATPTASLSMGINAGQLVAGAPVGIAATGLQSSAPYSVVVQSTPQTLASGNAVNGAVNSSVTIPSGLEAGWHTLTFTSTAADGSTLVSKLYFKVSGDGMLLSTTATTPAELAYTGSSDVTKLWGEVSLALIGFGILLFMRQRKRSN